MVAGNKNDTVVFWGCFIALVTTAFGFVGRLFLINTWAAEFDLDQAQAGRLAGIGVWPFAVSIIGFSLFIDRIGYKTSMIMAFLGHLIWSIMGFTAFFVEDKQLGFNLLYWGSLILALANGTVESFINPVVATMFSREKTKWLNILHAGWPGGLVAAGIITIFIDDMPWCVKVGIIAVPTVAYFLILLPRQFPVSERVTSGVSYREMLQEFGILGSIVVAVLLTLQLMDFFSNAGSRELSTLEYGIFIGIGVALVVSFGLYTQSLGRPLMFVLVLIMMPLATTEIGTDGWITGIMEKVAEDNSFHAGWVLVYTSAIMMVLRFYAGPIVHKLSPLGLLAVSAGLAIVGLYTLSLTTSLVIFGAATLYGLGKTFFWPTMLGVVSEQCPKGGALTLNAISGIGMLAVGTLGFPYIGKLQVDSENKALVANADINNELPNLVKEDQLTVLEERDIYEIIKYQAISDSQLNELILDHYVGQLSDESQSNFKDIVGDDKDLREKIAGLPLGEDDEEAQKELDKSIEAKSSDEQTQLKVVIKELEPSQKKIKDDIGGVRARSSQGALASMTLFPVIMLIGYILLILYFQSKGGYKPVEIGATGGKKPEDQEDVESW